MGEQMQAKTIGERLIAARKEQGMSQQEVADLIHVSSRSMQAYESDDVVPYRYLRELAEVLEKPMGWILHGDDAPEETGDLKPILLDILKELQKISAQTDHGKSATGSRVVRRPAGKKTTTAKKKTTSRRKA